MNLSDFLHRAQQAIDSGDFEAIEYLRGKVRAEYLPDLLQSWNANLPWPKKDAYITLLMDHTGSILKPIMEDGLNSPTVESRAYALCVITEDFGQFEQFLASGWVDAKRVDAAIARYRAGLD